MTTHEQNTKIINYLKPFEPLSVGIFGSYSRNEQHLNSDLDILVKLSKPISLLKLVEMELTLTDLLHLKVDLVTEGSLKNEQLKKYIFRDLKVIYDEK